jgi:hypothetical protein
MSRIPRQLDLGLLTVLEEVLQVDGDVLLRGIERVSHHKLRQPNGLILCAMVGRPRASREVLSAWPEIQRQAQTPVVWLASSGPPPGYAESASMIQSRRVEVNPRTLGSPR